MAEGRADKDDDVDENTPGRENKFSWDIDSVNSGVGHRRKMLEDDTNITHQVEEAAAQASDIA
eukprot:12327253-Karenia_brevis.AAC.1